MSRRVSLPGAAELFRVTGDPADDAATAGRSSADDRGNLGDAPTAGAPAADDLDAARYEDGAPGHRSRGAGSSLAARRAAAPTEEDALDQPAAASRAAFRAESEDADDGAATWAEPSRTRAVRRRTRVVDRRPTGRERHDEKITVYCSPEELLDLEHARLTLRAEFGLAIDRGRIVREAMAVILADLEAKGESSILVRRLRGRA